MDKNMPYIGSLLDGKKMMEILSRQDELIICVENMRINLSVE